MLEFAIYKKRSVENPNVPLAQLGEELDVQQGSVTVTAEKALGIPAFHQAVELKSSTIAGIPCKIFKRTSLGKEPDYDHPLYQLLTRRPHPLYSAFDFFKTLVTQRHVYGAAYARINRNKASGRVESLEIISPKNVKELAKTSEGVYVFKIRTETSVPGSMKEEIVPLANMIWLKGTTLDGISCQDPIQLFKSTLGARIAAAYYAKSFYENGAHINYAVEVPTQFSPVAKNNFFSEWKKLFSGILNAFRRPLLLDPGMKLHPLKMTPADAQMNDTQKVSALEIARMLDVPPHMLGAGENFTFSSIEVMNNHFIKFSIRNITRQIEEEFENKLLTSKEINNRTHQISFVFDSILASDTKTRAEKMLKEWQLGLITKNEYRQINDYNADEGGDYFLTPVNTYPTSEGIEPVNILKNNE